MNRLPSLSSLNTGIPSLFVTAAGLRQYDRTIVTLCCGRDLTIEALGHRSLLLCYSWYV